LALGKKFKAIFKGTQTSSNEMRCSQRKEKKNRKKGDALLLDARVRDLGRDLSAAVNDVWI
jgi:hypothetical protein